jgi:subfamily B ATP-binding cassette protein MsbA
MPKPSWTTFWAYAGRMLRYRRLFALAMVMAVLSGLSLGVGLIGAQPVLENILQPATEPGVPSGARNLPDLARELNRTWVFTRLGLSVPESWIDALPASRWAAVLWIVVALGTLTVFGAAVGFLHEYLSLTIVYRTITAIRREAFHKFLRLPLKDVVAGGTSDALTRLMSDTTMLAGGFTALISKAVTQVAKGAAALIAAFVIDWKLSLVAIPAAGVLLVVIRGMGRRIRRSSRSAQQQLAGLYGAASEAMQGLRVVKSHTTERYEAGRFHRINKHVMRELMRARTARAISSPLVEVLSILVLGGLTVVAAKAIIDGQLEFGRFMLTIVVLTVAGAALKPLTGIVNEVSTSVPAAERIDEMLRRTPEPGHDARLPKLARHRESIEFRDVTFTYPNATAPSLRGVSLKVRHGQRIAVVGPNGSGKTTLLSMVPRLFEPDVPAPGQPAGAVLIDGRDIREVSVRSLRRQIGVVTQETVLFRGTIATNIAYGAEEATPERIEAAARQARAHEFITAAPQGYATVVGEQGLTLSGGQRQRIAIARAVLRDPSILVLDEATSMIDADSERKIAEAIADFATGRTCLIVAHRLSTVINADLIVVMDAGRIVDQGTHAELLKRCEVYRMLAQHQLVQPPSSEGSAGDAAA